LKWPTIATTNAKASNVAVTPIQGINVDLKSGLTPIGLAKFAGKKAIKYIDALLTHHESVVSKGKRYCICWLVSQLHSERILTQLRCSESR
jgi:hypothetical protein